MTNASSGAGLFFGVGCRHCGNGACGRGFVFERREPLFEPVELAECGDVEHDEGEDDEEEDVREFLHEKIKERAVS